MPRFYAAGGRGLYGNAHRQTAIGRIAALPNGQDLSETENSMPMLTYLGGQTVS